MSQMFRFSQVLLILCAVPLAACGSEGGGPSGGRGGPIGDRGAAGGGGAGGGMDDGATCDAQSGGNETCEMLDPSTPVCLDGVCVECSDHDQCESEVCDRDANVCVPEQQIVYVANGGFLRDQETGEDTPGCGIPESKCLTIRYAVDNRLDEALGRIWVKVADGFYEDDKLELQDQTLRLIGGDEVRIGLGGAPNDVSQIIVKVGQGVDLLIDQMILRTLGAISEVIECAGEHRIPTAVRFHRSSAAGASGPGFDFEQHCDLEVIDSRINSNYRGGIVFRSRGGAERQEVVVLGSVIEDSREGVGIDVEGGRLQVEHTLISENRGGGIAVRDTDFVIRNNFIQNNGKESNPFPSSVGGVKIERDGPNERVFEFNTIVGNRVSEYHYASPGVDCETFAPIEIKNSIVWDNQGGNKEGLDPDAQISGFCEVSYSNVQGGITPDNNRPVVGEGNIDTDPLFVDPFRADYRIQAESLARDSANRAATLAVDFDGNPRPSGGGHDIGAHEVPDP